MINKTPSYSARNLILIGAVFSMLSGCTKALTIGSPEYACSGMPEGVTCVSARDVYTATESDDYQTQLRKEQEAAMNDNRQPDLSSAAVEENTIYVKPGDNPPIPARAQNPLPIRSQAVVMRIAVDPWEDEKGDLYIPGYIYTEIEPRRWEIGIRNTNSMDILKPLQTN